MHGLRVCPQTAKLGRRTNAQTPPLGASRLSVSPLDFGPSIVRPQNKFGLTPLVWYIEKY